MSILRRFSSVLALALIGCSLGAAPARAQAVITLATGFETPCGIALDGSGNVFAISSATNEVKEIEAVGGVIPASPTITTLGSGFHFPCGVAVDGSGNVFVADTGNNQVKEILAVGGSIPASPVIDTLGSGFGFNLPGLVALDGSGNLWVGDNSSHELYEIPATGGYSTVNTVGSGFSAPGGVAIDASGNVFVADGISGGAIYEIMAVGGVIPASPVINTIATGFNFPSDVKVDANGNVYVADTLNRAVKEILAVEGSIPASPTIVTLGSGFGFVLAIALDSQGNVYVCDDNGGAVKEILAPPTATQAVASTSLTQNFAAISFTPVTGAGGYGTLGYSVAPSLPAGLTLDSSTGAVTGTPSVASPTTSYTVTATDAASDIGTASFDLTVNSTVGAAQAVAATVLTENHAARSFAPVTGSGGTGALTYSVLPALPTGLAMASDTGAITGTATVTSVATGYTVTVTDALGATANASFSLTVNGPVAAAQAIASTVLTQNHAVAGFIPVTGSGGTSPLGYGVSPSLPTGLGLSSSTGAITGTATIASVSTSYMVTVTDANGATANASFSLTVNSAVAATQAIPSTVLTQNHAATAFTPVTGSGGTGSRFYGVSPSLPTGLSLSTATGAITGTPTVASASTSYTVTVTDANNATAMASFDLTVSGPVSATPAIGSTSLTQNRPAAGFVPVTGGGGTAPLSYSVSPALPTGLGMAAGTGAVTGTPSVLHAASSFTVTVTDANNATANAAFSLAVAAAPASSTTALVSSLNPAGFGTTVTLTATVGGSGTTPTGAVNFWDGGSPLGSGALTAGRASLTVPTLAVGSHAITASYGGDANFAGSGATLTETIQPDTAAIAGQAYSFQGTLGVTGSSGTDNAHFSSAAPGAVDPVNGHLFVADTGNHRVQVIDTTSLAVVATIGVAGVSGGDNAHLFQPGGVGFDAARGRVFVADTGNQRVQVFDATSFAYLSTLGVTGNVGTDNLHLDLPASAQVDAARHRLYIADRGNQRVQVYDLGTLAVVATLGTAGVAGGDGSHLAQPHDAGIDPSTNQIMVADTGNGRVQLFDATSFAYAGTIGGPGLVPADNAYFGAPISVAFDPTANLVLIADAGAIADDRVQVLDALTYFYVLTLGTTGSPGAADSQFQTPFGIVADPAHRRIFVGDSLNDRIQIFADAPPVTFAAVLPGSRSVQLGHPATVFASVINTGATQLGDCRVALPANAPPGLALAYQTTDPASNALTGAPDVPAPIAANQGLQTFLVTLQGTAAVSASGLPLDFDCDGVAPASVAIGVDTVDLLISAAPVPDIIALSATPSGDGIIRIPQGGAAAFAVASSNVGIAATVTASVDTGTAALPLQASLCQSNPGTGQCLALPAATVTLNDVAGAAPTFSIFLQAAAPIAFDPAASRVFVRFKDARGIEHGSTSVAVETQ